MNTENSSEKLSASVSRRAMLGKSAKYAALIPAASLIVTKANAHTFTGSSEATCIEEFLNSGGNNSGGAAAGHCSGSHGLTTP